MERICASRCKKDLSVNKEAYSVAELKTISVLTDSMYDEDGTNMADEGSYFDESLWLTEKRYASLTFNETEEYLMDTARSEKEDLKESKRGLDWRSM